MSNLIKVQLPAMQPDRCRDCPLLGMIPKYIERPKNSKETMICIGTMEAMSKRAADKRASECDSHHPLRRPCDDGKWQMWMTYPQRRLPVNQSNYKECRYPYEQTLQMQIKFHR